MMGALEVAGWVIPIAAVVGAAIWKWRTVVSPVRRYVDGQLEEIRAAAEDSDC